MIRKIILLVLDFILPLSCSFCGRHDYYSSKLSICKKCIRENAKVFAAESDFQFCNICKSELTGDSCKYCESRNVFFRELSFIRLRGDFEKEVIQKIKFGNAPYLSNLFRLGLRKIMGTFKGKNYRAIIIIPSNKTTIRRRPNSVCKPILEFLTKHLRISSISPLLKKSKELQSGKSFRDRFLHAQSAFIIQKKFQNKLSGNYLLVDDVFTTGATINEIAKLLIMNGANAVDVLVLVKGKI